jgi:PIN domain nuclease of toxin-antitoxin system
VKLLLDTSTFLWMAVDPPRLSRVARRALTDADNEVYLSTASAWEIAVKYALGKLALAEEPATFVPRMRQVHRVAELPISEAAALGSAKLPRLHGDPFDRMLVCQAIAEGMSIVTDDRWIQRYPVRITW